MSLTTATATATATATTVSRLRLVSISCGICVLGIASIAGAQPFDTDATGEPPRQGIVTVEPWRTVLLDPQYGGHWVVAGDLDGDGQIDIVSARNVDQSDNHYTSAVAAQRLDGSLLWTWGDPTTGRRELHHDVACQIHDLDQDGAQEVILAAQEQLVVLDGRTGKTRRQFPIPQHASDCIVFADLTGRGWPSDILVKNRYQQIWAYAANGQLLWTAAAPGGYRTAHQPLPVDLDGDGRDEILAGYACLNSDGSERWVFELQADRKNGGHADCWRVVDAASDPTKTRLVMTMCGGNTLVVTDGNGQLVWKQTGHHYESVDVGKVRRDVPGVQLVVDVDHLPQPPKPLCLFSDQGALLGKIQTDYTRHHILVDWDGDGIQEIGSALPRGLFDGYGRRLLTFQIGPDQSPLLMDEVDLDGNGPRSVMLTTLAKGGEYRAYLYRAYLYRGEDAPATQRGKPEGTGLNFTLY